MWRARECHKARGTHAVHTASLEKALAPEVHRCVVNEVPDKRPDETAPALIDLRCLNELLLDRGRQPPVHRVSGALLLVGTHHEARIVRPEARREHARTPWPPCRLHEGLRVFARLAALPSTTEAATSV